MNHIIFGYENGINLNRHKSRKQGKQKEELKLLKKFLKLTAVSLILCFSALATETITFNDITYGKVSAQEQKTIFSDIKESAWYYDDVKYVHENGLMNGTSETEFSPTDVTTRGMIVTILWRLEGEPVEDGILFQDVKSAAYYHHAVSWAAKNQIVNGYSKTSFGPDDTATREQFAAIMYRYAAYKEYDVSAEAVLDKYNDKEEISEYALNSLKWANANGFITGTSETTISPKDNVQRCQVAAVLRRLCEKFSLSKKKTDNTDNSIVNNDDKINESIPTTSDKANNGTSGGGYSGGSDNSSGQTTQPEHDETDNVIQQATIKLKTTYGDPGETITVPVDLTENPGILGMVLSLEYDENAMQLVNVENGEAVSDVLTLTHSQKLESGIRFLWDGIEVKPEDVKKGNLLTLTFELSPDVMPGKRYPLQLKYESGKVVDTNLSSIYLRILQGYVEIKNLD